MRAKKFLPLTILVGLFITVAGFSLLLYFYNSEKPVKINANRFTTSVSKNEIAKLFGNAVASRNPKVVLGAESPIEVEKEEPAKKADFGFNAIAPTWEEETPPGTDITVQIRTSRDGQNWSSWFLVEQDEHADAKDGVTPQKNYGNLLVTEGQYVQERLIFKTENLEKVPEIRNLEIIYIDSKEKLNLLERLLKRVKIKIGEVLAAGDVQNRPAESPPICSRACWGADESIYVPGEDYAPIKKMIIHHTVTANNDPNPKATIRAIYYFHNVVRGWGDIGYNFLVDANGTIYEGRYGGDGVIGAHARGYNTGSVGVGVLGDYRYSGVNKKIQNALHKIAVWKFSKHKVNPEKYTTFGSPALSLPPVFYHGVVDSTSCAGEHLNKFTPNLRKLAHYMPQQILLRDSSGTRNISGSNSITVADLLNSYKNQGIVAPNYIRKISAFPIDGTTPPSDPNYSSQWDLAKLNAPNVWKETSGGSPSVKAAVLDTGVAYEDYNPPGSANYSKGPDFASTNFVAGYDYVNGDNHPNDDHGHGTSVASVIASSTNNGEGSAALAYNVSIMPIKVCDKDGWCLDSDVVAGIDFARTSGAKVINMSFGGDYDSAAIQAAINAAWNAGTVVVAAAGNDGQPTVSYPARGSHVIAVGALDSSDNKAYYSNYGKALDLVAPGGDASGGTGDLLYQFVSCTSMLDCRTFDYNRFAGTSFSASLVSAVAALLISKGYFGAGNIESIMVSTAMDLGATGYDIAYGYGRVSPYAALNFTSVSGYILDGFGGVHAFGKADVVSNSSHVYWPGWDIARSITLLPDGSGGYILDGFGGIHAFGLASPISHDSHAYWPGFDIARDVVLLSSSTASSPKGYILDGFGGIHNFGGAPPIPHSSHAYWPGWDIANALVMKPDDNGGYILDGFGGIHNFGGAPPIPHSSHAYWPGWDIARDFTLIPGTAGGYILDGYGGVHPFGGANPIAISAYWGGWDIARAITFSSDGTKGYVLDGFGGIHALGLTQPFYKSSYAYWPGWDIANWIVLK